MSETRNYFWDELKQRAKNEIQAVPNAPKQLKSDFEEFCNLEYPKDDAEYHKREQTLFDLTARANKFRFSI